MKTPILFAIVLLLIGVFSSISTAQNGEPNLDSYIESLRTDLRADKVALISDVMRFDDQESRAFWPVYRKYEAEVTKINDQRIALIKSYSDKFVTMTNAEAKTIIDQTIDLQSSRTELTRKYAKEFQKAGLSSVAVAKFLQFEHRLNLLVDLQIASELPALWIKPTGEPTPHQ
jgi:uncharacterized membrane protein